MSALMVEDDEQKNVSWIDDGENDAFPFFSNI